MKDEFAKVCIVKYPSALVDLCSTVGIGLADLAIGKLSHTNAIGVQDVLLAVSKLYGLDPCLLNFLYGAIWEDALLFTVFKNALDRTIREANEQQL